MLFPPIILLIFGGLSLSICHVLRDTLKGLKESTLIVGIETLTGKFSGKLNQRRPAMSKTVMSRENHFI
jgi:hypothetical protein